MRLAFLIFVGLLALGAGCAAVAEDHRVTYGESACAACVREACRTELTACGEDSYCGSYLLCLSGCELDRPGDAWSGCEQTCRERLKPGGSERADALFACRERGEGAVCAACGKSREVLTPGTAFLHQECPVSEAVDACQRCTETSCCDSLAAYNKNPDCAALVECHESCNTAPDPDVCIVDCKFQNENGYSDYSKKLTCQRILCSEVCPIFETSTCQQCSDEKCLEFSYDCDSSTECLLYTECIGSICTDYGRLSNPDRVCVELCNQAFPEGRRAAAPWLLCVEQNCGPCA